MRLNLKHVLFIAFLLSSVQALSQVDRNQVLFGPEPSFQDQEMVLEPGRMTMSTPHKEKKFKEMKARFLEILGQPENITISPINRADFKPGFRIQIPGRGIFITNMEPVCIEWNQLPVTYENLINAWAPVFQAAKDVQLSPYVQIAAERSGMGHIHVGGNTVAENPYFKHPTLLRNMMVYLHQHPSLLWGFAEAYDIGSESNIETLHGGREEKFKQAVEQFDAWYSQASQSERLDGGFKFLNFLYKKGGDDFFRHYRFINLEHVKKLIGGSLSRHGDLEGKYTIEHRNFRPFKTEYHLKANAELLLKMMDKFSSNDLLVPFVQISEQQYRNFFGTHFVESDWELVSRELNFEQDPLWAEMISEYTQNLIQGKLQVTYFPNFEILTAYSEKTKKGHHYEILMNNPVDAESILSTTLEFRGQKFLLEWTEIQYDGKKIKAAVFDTSKTTLQPYEILNSLQEISLQHKSKPISCKDFLETAA